jgi:hypothetical protein
MGHGLHLDNGRTMTSFNSRNDFGNKVQKFSSMNFWFRGTQQNAGLLSVHDTNSWDATRSIKLKNGDVCATSGPGEEICTSDRYYADDRWHMVTHTLDLDGAQHLSIDDTEVATKSSPIVNRWKTQWSLGFVYGTNIFTGTIDQFRFYNRPLKDSERHILFREPFEALGESEASAIIGWNGATRPIPPTQTGSTNTGSTDTGSINYEPTNTGSTNS